MIAVARQPKRWEWTISSNADVVDSHGTVQKRAKPKAEAKAIAITAKSMAAFKRAIYCATGYSRIEEAR